MTKSRITRTLLAGTVLTAAPITALHAGTITETTDFGNYFGSQSLLPAGTTQVDGHVDWENDFQDWFTFQGLGAGTYTLRFTVESYCGGVNALDSSFSTLSIFSNGCESVNSPVVFSTGSVPNDGKLVVQVLSENGAAAYSVMLSAPLAETAPEPSTFAAGLLAGGAMLWRRRAKSN